MDEQFEREKRENIRRIGQDDELKSKSTDWLHQALSHQYCYHFNWMGLPIIQFPADIVAMQEVVWETRPDIIIETGIARGGSMVFYASMLQLLGNGGRVVGVDIDIRTHNRVEIEKHLMFPHITMIEGSSVDPATAAQVREIVRQHEQNMTEDRSARVMVVLDSMHTHDHVLKELEFYSPLVTKGCYLMVFDTFVEFLPEDTFPNRPWHPGNNPYTAVTEFLKQNPRFELDRELNDKLLTSASPGGYLRCLAD